MLTKDDLFSTVSTTAVGLKQEPPAKRGYVKKSNRKRVPSQAERYRICKLLEEHLTPKDANGLVSYLNGMDDEKIGDLIGPHISNDTVKNMRQQIFGTLRRGHAYYGQDQDLITRITKLEEMFNKLAEEIGSALRIP